jgi:hypothetical protein
MMKFISIFLSPLYIIVEFPRTEDSEYIGCLGILEKSLLQIEYQDVNISFNN